MNTNQTFSKWLVAILLAISLGLTACGGGDSGAAGLDTDGDGLTDSEEQTLGTSPVLTDTDGDGYSDGLEVVDYGFNPVNNNYKFNPLIADVPQIQIEFVSLPDIDLVMTASSGSEVSQAVERSTSSASSYSRSRTSTESLTVEVSASLTDFGVSTSGTVEESVSWSAEQSYENSQAYSDAVNNIRGEELTGGGIAIAVDVKNEGHLAFTVSNLVLSANLVNPRNKKVLEPLGNLVFDSVSTWNDFPVAPGGRAGPFTYSNGDLTVAETQALLRDSSGLSVKVAAYDITDAKGNSYTHDLTAIGAKTAVVTIDYGPDNSRGVRSYLVATNSDPARLEVPVDTVFNDILRLPYEQDASGLTSINGVAVDSLKAEKWMVVHRYISGEDPMVDVYGPDSGYDFNSIVLRSGHTLHLVRAADTDNDGLGLREELLFGTDPTKADSDGDTLIDGDEVKVGWENTFNQTQVYSSPVLLDTDDDGLEDNLEKAAGSNPNLVDTDGDGQADDVDSEPTVAAILPSSWKTVAAGEGHVLGIKADGTLWAWGNNAYGQLGIEDKTLRRLPVQVGSGSTWVAVFPCSVMSFAIDEAGALWAWGGNSWGTLGLGDGADRLQPVRIGAETNWAKVSCSAAHTMALRTDGSLWAWGFGNLGLGDVTYSSTPERVGTEYSWYDVATTDGGALLLEQPGDSSFDNLWVIGQNNRGELTVSGGTRTTPELTGARGIKLASGSDTAFHINATGNLYSSGANDNGKLGTGGTVDRNGWQWVGINYDQVSSGQLHTLAITKAPGAATGTLYAWGNSALVNSSTPALIGSSTNWQQVTAGNNFSMALDGNGYLWAWGSNASGQVGIDSSEPNITSMSLVY